MISVEVTLLGEAWETVHAIAPPEMWQSWLETWLVLLDPKVSPIQAYELSIQLTTDQQIAALNAQYRGQNHPTDVLSFAALENEALPTSVLAQIPLNLGDVIISVPVAQRQCAHHGHGLVEELAWLAAHGFLHLLGWDHPDEAHLQRMLLMQRKLLEAAGLSLEHSEYFPSGDLPEAIPTFSLQTPNTLESVF